MHPLLTELRTLARKFQDLGYAKICFILLALAALILANDEEAIDQLVTTPEQQMLYHASQ